MSPPELRPGLVASLYAQEEQLQRPEEGPRAVGEVEHAVGFVPAEVVLDVGGELGLDGEGDERDDEEDGGEGVFLFGFEVGGEGGAGGGAAGAHGCAAAGERGPEERGGVAAAGVGVGVGVVEERLGWAVVGCVEHGCGF